MSAHYPIPTDALDDRLAWTGMAGTGKTYDSGTAIERVLREKSRVCIADPLGVWWGLRLRADGETPSPFRVAIFGGPHGDIAITETSGKLIGETVAGTTESCIIDLSEFDTEASQRRFMLAFIVALYAGVKGDLLHLVLDEADMWAPQRIMDKEGEATKLHHHMQKIVRRGRVKGFIPWLITQRPAELSKSVLSQMDGIVAHQLIAPQDVKALMEWVSGRADAETAEMIRTGLPAFGRGEAAVYIPRRRVLKIVQFPEKTTFDSSRSPDRGEKKNRPDIALKPLDIDALKTRLAKVEAEAKANDPKALKAEIAKLKAERDQLSREVTTTTAKKPKADPDAIKAAEERGFEQAKKKLAAAAEVELQTTRAALLQKFGDAVGPLMTILKEEMAAIRGKRNLAFGLTFTPSGSPGPTHTRPVAPSRALVATTTVRAKPSSAASGDGNLSGPEQRIVDAVRWWNVLGVQAPSHAQVGFVAGYSHKSGTWSTYLSRLRSAGMIEGRGDLVLTAEGAKAAHEPDVPPSGDHLRAVVVDKINGPLRRILIPIIETFPDALTHAEAGKRAGYSPQSGTWSTYLSRLRSLDLIDGRGDLKAQDWLFPDAA